MSADERYEFIQYLDLKHVKILVNSITHCTVHFHGAWEFGIVIRGSASVKTHDGVFTSDEGDIILFEPYTFHEIIAAGTMSTLFCFVQISPNFCTEYFSDFHKAHFFSQNLSQCLGAQPQEEILNNIVRLSYSFFRKTAYYQIRCVGYISQIVECFLRYIPHAELTPQERYRNEKRAVRIQHITEYIDARFFEPNILHIIAKDENLSVPYFSSLFRKTFNMSFQTYIQNYRLNKAIDLFSSNKSLVEICEEVGFSNIRYFNKYCKLTYGLSARELRHEYAQHLVSNDKADPFLQQVPLQNTVFVYDPDVAASLLVRFFPQLNLSTTV